MSHLKSKLAIVALALLSLTATAAVSVRLSPNWDGTLNTKYPNGDKPIGGECPAGWTCAAKGDGGGTIAEVSATEFDFVVFGTSARAKYKYAYQDAGTGDVQLIARITNTYAGNLNASTGFGIGLTEGTTDASFWHQCFSLYTGAEAVRSTSGTGSGDLVTTDGSPGQSRPRYVAMTYDVSAHVSKCHESANGSTWTEVASVSRTYSDVLAYVFGASGDPALTSQATLDNIALSSTITVYTPSDPPVGSAPTLVSAIPNQSAAQGSAFSLATASYFSSSTAMTFAASGFPGSSGLSINTSTGLISGTPTAQDVSGSPYNVTVTATNVNGSTPDVFQMTVSASSGDTFNIGTGTATFNCTTQGVGPGDTIVLAAGNHTPLEILNCSGSSASPITIRNDTAAGSAASFVKNTQGYALKFTNISNVVVDGTGKWSGAPAGTCGIDPTTFAEGRTQCGIKATRTSTAVGHPTQYVFVTGTSTNYTIKGVEIDGLQIDTGGASGIGIQINDHALKWADYPGVWREDITLANMYVHDLGSTSPGSGECIYFGPNANVMDWPIRRATVEYNIVEDCSRNGIEMKFWLQGPNYVRHNYVYRAGQGTESNQHTAVDVIDGGDVEIYGNYVEEAGENGIMCWNSEATAARTPDDGPYYCHMYNNIIVRPGAAGPGTSHCMTFGQPAGAFNNLGPVTARNNTCISPVDNAANFSSNIPNSVPGEFTSTETKIAQDNLTATSGSCTNNRVSGALTNSNNRCGTVAAQNFVNSGADNYELTSTSPACNASTANAPALDYEKESRPQDSADDQGADEAAACP